MNYWTKLSVDYANQRNYLDDLFAVYPTIPEGIRNINKSTWKAIEKAFNKKDDINLVTQLLNLDLFPIKDSYVAYFKRDRTALSRNPKTVQRLCGRLYEMGLNEVFERCSEPKETNRQIGPLFRRWVQKGVLGAKLLSSPDFENTDENSILEGSDTNLMNFAKKNLNYSRDKGLDLVARFNGKYIIGEAKFLTDFGGHQNAQFEDALTTLNTPKVKAIVIAILDGVLYIRGRTKMFTYINKNEKMNIMSALVLREFLYQI